MEMLPPWLVTRQRVFVALALLFAGYVVVRCLTSPTADLDESEQLVFTQSFQWGYGPQPPLYTWLQIIFFRVFTPSIVALSLFKNLLLFAAFVGVYSAGKKMARSHPAGVVAALSMLFVPQFAWESQRDLTHSVLATTAAAATMAVAIRLIERRSTGLYLLLGVCAGVGLLSNYSYALFAVGLIFGALFIRELRPVILDPRMLLAGAVALVALSPHLHWAWTNSDIVLGATRKLKMRSDLSGWSMIFTPLLPLSSTFLMHVITIVLIYLLLVPRPLLSLVRGRLSQPLGRWFLIGLLAPPVCALLVMVGTHATEFRGRWLQPVYILLPILLAVEVTPRLNHASLRRLVFGGLIAAAAVGLALPARARLAGVLHRSNPINISFEQLAAAISAKVESADAILADGKFVGGNLRLLFPGKPVLTPRFASPHLSTGSGPLVFVFEAWHRDEPIPAVAEFVARFSADELSASSISYVDVPMRFEPGHSRRFGVAVLQRRRAGPR